MENLVRRNGVWVVRKMVPGRKWPLRISTKQTDRKLAEKVARKILGDIDKGVVDDIIGASRKKKMPTYGEVARTVIKTVKHTQVYKQFLAPSIEAWDTRPINDITPTDCLTFVAEQVGTSRSINCVKQFTVLSSAVFNRAMADGIATRNPWHGVPKQAKPKGRARDRVLTHDEQEKLFAELPPLVQRMARVQVEAGLRIGEVFALVPKTNLDFANGFIRVTVAKGDKPRNVPMFPGAKDALLEQLDAIGERMDSDKPLFARLDRIHVLHLFAAAVKRAGIPRCTTHDLRRTFGTRMAVDMNVAMKTLAIWMGHSNIQITAKFYTHLDDAASKRAAQEVMAKMGPGKVVGIGERADKKTGTE